MIFTSYTKTNKYFEFITDDGLKYVAPATDVIMVNDLSGGISVKLTGTRKTIGVLVGNTPPTPEYDKLHMGFSAIEPCSFSFTNSIDYSLDEGATWQTLAANTPTPTINAGDKIMFKANLVPTSPSGIGTFSSTGKFNPEGNIMSLLYGDAFEGKDTLTGNYGFYALFRGSQAVDASNLVLPATAVTEYAYNGLFQNCTSLTSAPELPATSVGKYSYAYMFEGCTSLVNAPELPATTLDTFCYVDMFKDCTSLTTPMSILPAETLTNQCYRGMFRGCTALTKSPELPATTVPALGYSVMFQNCSSLNYVKCLATNISAMFAVRQWVENVAANGTFVKSASMATWPTGVSGIPNGWTVEDA